MPCRQGSPFKVGGYAPGAAFGLELGLSPKRGHSPLLKKEVAPARHSLASHRGGEAGACNDK